jgi:hypothetical protein
MGDKKQSANRRNKFMSDNDLDQLRQAVVSAGGNTGRKLPQMYKDSRARRT